MKTQKTDHHDIHEAVHAVAKEQVTWRRHLHQFPELSNEEFETTAFLKDRLKQLGLKLLSTKTATGLLAELKGRGPGSVVVIRSDIDALPIIEETKLAFRSRHEGRMHACGHDIHMATVLGTAAVLSKLKDTFPGTVRFIFQPAEELPPGGARPMIESGAVADARMIFGLHVDPEVPTGRIGLRDGVTMASVFDFTLIIRGVSGHAARPHTAVDAIVTAAEVIGSLQTIVSREIDPIDSVAITFGRIEGGTASNVIANEVRLAGTARTLSEKTFRRMPKLIARTVSGICKARGASYTIEPIADYPVLSNDPAANKILRTNFDQLFGPGKITDTPPVLGGEDFACYLQEVPGAMFRLGVRNRKIKAEKPWHSPLFIADEAAMPFGTALLAAAARDVLNRNH